MCISYLSFIAADVKVKTVDRTPFLNEVKEGSTLTHVDAVADRSDPSILLFFFSSKLILISFLLYFLPTQFLYRHGLFCNITV
jgi:hypothetical protein